MTIDGFLDLFRIRLEAAGFSLAGRATPETWEGIVNVAWGDPTSARNGHATHRVAIVLVEGFPYHAPSVVCTDSPPLERSLHLMPGNPPTLCLWSPTENWEAGTTAGELLERIYRWFVCYHTGEWPSQPMPDLHLYLKRIGTVLTGEEWKPEPEPDNGSFALWHHADLRGSSIATSGLTSRTTESEPEPRLGNHLGLTGRPKSRPGRTAGVWLRLPTPLVPVASLRELFAIIDEARGGQPGWAIQTCARAVGEAVRGKGFPIALGYPDPTGGERWLFLWAEFPADRKKKAYPWSDARFIEGVSVKSLWTAPARKRDLLRRSEFLSSHLQEKQVVVFGVGALGSPTALLLAKAGVGRLDLIDGDVIMPGNPMRHACGMNWVGCRKAWAVAVQIRNHNVDCAVAPHSATWSRDKLLRILEGADLVVDTTADRNFSLLLSGLCVQVGKSLITAFAQRRARVGKILVRLGSSDPCLVCYRAHEWSEDDNPPVPADNEETFVEDGCGGVTEEGVALDLDAVANQVARAAVTVLRGISLPGNLGILVNEAVPGAPEGFLQQVGMHWRQNAAVSGCGGCGHA